MVPDVLAQALVVKLGIVTPALVGMMLLLRRNPAPWRREWLQVGSVLAITVASTYLICTSDSPWRRTRIIH